MIAPYRAVLAHPGLGAVYAASVLARLPIGMTGLAILLLVQGATGSFAAGGAATGAYVAGLALVAPLIGRVIDRRGPREVLWASALLFPMWLAALITGVTTGVSATTLLLFATCAGATFPPVTVCVRTFLRQRLQDEGLLSTAYSLDSVLIELMFIVGPLAVALLVAHASAEAAIAMAAGCGFLGTLLFLQLPALRAWRIEPRMHSTLLGPLSEPSFIALVSVVLCYATAFGLAELGATAFATEAGRPALAGVFLGLMSVGSAAGGLAYGSRRWPSPLLLQFGTTLAIMGAGLLLLALPHSMFAFAALCVIAGVVMAPALIIQSMLVAKAARPQQMTEAFTWSTSALLAGVGLGMALGGVLVEAWRSPAAFAAAGIAALAAAGATFGLARR